MFEEL